MSPFGLDPAARPNSATNRHSNGRTGTPGSFYEYSDVGGDVFVKKGKSTATNPSSILDKSPPISRSCSYLAPLPSSSANFFCLSVYVLHWSF